jgi:hypothetical protein
MTSWCAHLAKGDLKYEHTCYVHAVRVNCNICEKSLNEILEKESLNEILEKELTDVASCDKITSA